MDEGIGEELGDGVNLGVHHGADKEDVIAVAVAVGVREMVGARELGEGPELGNGEGRDEGSGSLGQWGRGTEERSPGCCSGEGGEGMGMASGGRKKGFEGGIEREGEREALGWRCHCHCHLPPVFVFLCVRERERERVREWRRNGIIHQSIHPLVCELRNLLFLFLFSSSFLLQRKERMPKMPRKGNQS